MDGPPAAALDQFAGQMEFVGIKSVGIVLLTALFTGAVFALQSGKVYGLFNMESMVGATVGLSLTREMAPVFAALMVTARACSAMAAELGTMRVTEQIDALETMAVNPIQYLVVPRLVACTVMVPLLTMLYNYVGVVGAYIVGIYLLGINDGPFMNAAVLLRRCRRHLRRAVQGRDLRLPDRRDQLLHGLSHARGGEGGRARRRRARWWCSAVTILVADYFLTTWILEFFTE